MKRLKSVSCIVCVIPAISVRNYCYFRRRVVLLGSGDCSSSEVYRGVSLEVTVFMSLICVSLKMQGAVYSRQREWLPSCTAVTYSFTIRTIQGAYMLVLFTIVTCLAVIHSSLTLKQSVSCTNQERQLLWWDYTGCLCVSVSQTRLSTLAHTVVYEHRPQYLRDMVLP